MKKANTLVLSEKELFKIVGGVCNIMIQITIFGKSKFIIGRSHVKRREIGFQSWISAKKLISRSVSPGRIFNGMKDRWEHTRVNKNGIFENIILLLGGNNVSGVGMSDL